MLFNKTLFSLGGGANLEAPIYLADNGVTIKASEAAMEGEFYTLSLGEGLPVETYYVWPNANPNYADSLIAAISNTYDSETDSVLIYGGGGKRIKVGNIVTSRITNFNGMFSYGSKVPVKYSGVSKWDTSNVLYILNVLDSTSSRTEIPRIEYWNLESCIRLARSFTSFQDHQIPDLSRWRLADGAEIDLPSFWPENYRPRNSGPKYGTLQVELASGERVFIEELDKPVKGVKATLQGLNAELESSTFKVTKIIDWLYIGGAENTARNITLSFGFDLTEAPNYLPEWVTDLSKLFSYHPNLNCDFDLWTTNKVENFNSFLHSCGSFNGKGVETFSLYSATDIGDMLRNCYSWEPEEILWNPHKVTSALRVFRGCSKFNAKMDKVHFPLLRNASFFFTSCIRFNQPVEHLFSKALDVCSSMFQGCTDFNQPLARMPTNNVYSMADMLRDCTSFNQDLSGMCVPRVTEEPLRFDLGATSWTLPRPVWGTCPNG